MKGEVIVARVLQTFRLTRWIGRRWRQHAHLHFERRQSTKHYQESFDLQNNKNNAYSRRLALTLAFARASVQHHLNNIADYVRKKKTYTHTQHAHLLADDVGGVDRQHERHNRVPAVCHVSARMQTQILARMAQIEISTHQSSESKMAQTNLAASTAQRGANRVRP